MATVCYIFRKPQLTYFSIERIFYLLSGKVSKHFTVERLVMPHGRLLPWNVISNFRALRRVKADIYHVTGDVHYLVLGLPRNKTILTIHDCVFMYRTSGLKRLFLKYMFLVWPVRHCRVITTISEKTREDIIRFTGCAPEKVVVVPNPVDEHFVYKKKTFNRECPVLLFVGTAPHKNLARVIEALKGVNCVLDIVGKVPDNLKDIMKTDQVKMRESINISNEELADKYVDCDALLFPSTFEGFGLPIVEAQKSGRPVITSIKSPMKDVAGKGACIVDPTDVQSIRQGILRVIEDEEYRNCIVQEGFENLKKYLPEAIADRYMDQYRTVLS
jgi:glycosyltransferase involved in cell wall biosynthesis